MGYEAVVFDLDGTLLDTLDDLTDATNAALEKVGLPRRSREEVRAFVGNGVVKLIERAVGERKELTENALAAFKEYYAVHCADKTAPYAGILELLNVLREKGVRTAVLSNKPDFAVKSLAKSYFDGLFLSAAGENEAEGIRKKPAPDALFSVMKQLGVAAEKAVYVGDSEVDIQTAKNAGVDYICVTWGFRSKEFLTENGGKLFVEKPLEILQYIEK